MLGEAWLNSTNQWQFDRSVSAVLIIVQVNYSYDSDSDCYVIFCYLRSSS